MTSRRGGGLWSAMRQVQYVAIGKHAWVGQSGDRARALLWTAAGAEDNHRSSRRWSVVEPARDCPLLLESLRVVARGRRGRSDSQRSTALPATGKSVSDFGGDRSSARSIRPRGQRSVTTRSLGPRVHWAHALIVPTRIGATRTGPTRTGATRTGPTRTGPRAPGHAHRAHAHRMIRVAGRVLIRECAFTHRTDHAYHRKWLRNPGHSLHRGSTGRARTCAPRSLSQKKEKSQ